MTTMPPRLRPQTFGLKLLALGWIALSAAPLSAQNLKLFQTTVADKIECKKAGSYSAEQRALLWEVNMTRADHGLQPLRYNAALARAAHDHACTIAQMGRLSHTGAGGTAPSQRALAAGYEYKTVAENLGLGFHGAKQAVSLWMRSPAHREALLLPQIDDAALGLVKTSSGQLAWVLMMGKTR